MSTVTKVNDLINELEHIVSLLSDADTAVEVEDALEELANQAGTINTIISEQAK